MADHININNEVDADANADAHEANQTVKSEPANDDDENETTPLRDERADSAEPVVTNTCRDAPGWESDAENQAEAGNEATTTSPGPSFGLSISIKKRSPSNDCKITSKRVSNTAPDKNGIENEEAAVVRIKPEIQFESTADDNGMDLPDDYFDELLKEEIEPIVKKEEKLERNDIRNEFDFLDNYTEEDFEGVSNACGQRELFDSMDLEPPVAEVQQDENELESAIEIEAKLKKRKRELEKLKKKEKKNKKVKKRRRSRSPSESSQTKHNRKERRTRSTASASSLSRISMETIVKPDPSQLDYLPVHKSERSVKVINISKLMVKNGAEGAAPPLTIKEKRKLAVERVTAVLNILQKPSSEAPEEFLVVETIRKLPNRASFMSCDIFENPSPLCKNFNVKYKFNSTIYSNISMKKWGLESMPDVTTKLLRLTGIDVNRLMELQSNSKMPLQKLRLKQAAEKAASQADNESFSTGLYKSVATQTCGRIGANTRDAGVQATVPTVTKSNGIFWLDSRFNETDLSQPHVNVMMALKELCAEMPRSTHWANELFLPLKMALAIKRAENKELANL